ncbi:outer membrane beta-barrel protein [Urechidicola croceus]|uniref:Outer membrane protein beta-barrel domain-containing protein n=1 Tax=Urechidicola croceus TaxID=1850246 RepID=A0A1D8P4Z2_9FLAO|nr:outer membrane beta-barrel protein [Urechidicola croceus]AOW19624.1 hypothetical protein LPB138_02540 [Urechidicola croceus]
MKKKIIFTLILCLIISVANAQESKNSLEFSINPNSSYRSLNSNYDYLDERDDKVILLDFSIGYIRTISKKFSIETGVRYSKKGFNRTPVTFINYPFDINSPHSLKYRLNYIGVPIGLRYNIFKINNFTVGISAGVNNNLLLKASYEPFDIIELTDFITGGEDTGKPQKRVYKGKVLKDIGYNIYNPELFMKLLFNYSFKNMTIGVSPNYNLSLKDIGKKEYSFYHTESEKLYSLGIQFSISRAF